MPGVRPQNIRLVTPRKTRHFAGAMAPLWSALEVCSLRTDFRTQYPPTHVTIVPESLH
jgi:hypothetical protein